MPDESSGGMFGNANCTVERGVSRLSCGVVAVLVSGVVAWGPVSAQPAPAPPLAARAARVFDVAGSGDAQVLRAERVLRMPGTSRERARLPVGSRVGAATTRRVQAPGGLHDVVLWEVERPTEADGGFGDAAAVLAVFPVDGLEPTDVAEVKADRETSLGESLVPLGAAQAFTVRNAHHNAGQPYLETSLFHIHGGRLRRIARVFTLGESSGCERAFEETVSFTTRDEGQPLPTVIATVVLVQAPRSTHDSCGDAPRPRERRRTFRQTYRWDPRKAAYVDAGGTLAQLDAFNDSRF